MQSRFIEDVQFVSCIGSS